MTIEEIAEDLETDSGISRDELASKLKVLSIRDVRVVLNKVLERGLSDRDAVSWPDLARILLMDWGLSQGLRTQLEWVWPIGLRDTAFLESFYEIGRQLEINDLSHDTVKPFIVAVVGGRYLAMPHTEFFWDFDDQQLKKNMDEPSVTTCSCDMAVAAYRAMYWKAGT